MRIEVRIILSIVTFISAFLFIYWVPFSLIPAINRNNTATSIISAVFALALTIYLWKETKRRSNDLVGYAVLGGIIVGAVGFILGFFGPMIFRPDANLGPLLGIFFTGPIGFILGLAGGAAYGVKRRKVNRTKAGYKLEEFPRSGS